MIVRNPSGRRRLRVMHVILSRGFAGSERAAAESCAALAGRHAVALVVRSDHREPGGSSIRDELAPGIEVFEVPPRLRTQHRIEEIIRAWAPDVVHTHLRRGTLRTGEAARQDHVHDPQPPTPGRVADDHW